LMGHSREELIGKTDYNFFPKDQAEFFTQKDREVLQNKTISDISEETIDSKELGLRILHTKKIPILDTEGNPQYLLGISEDITERKKAEELLSDSEEKYKTLFKSDPDYTILVSVDGVIRDLNVAAEQIIGKYKEELVGKHFRELLIFPKEDLTLHECSSL
jgi:PAS domain S-box-containing protein